MVTNRISKLFIDNVATRDLVTVDGTPVHGQKAIVDLDSGRVLGTASSRYKIVRNSDLLKAVMPQIEEMKFDTTPIINMARGGAITYFKFLGKKTQGEIRKGDIVRFGLEFFNSYDGSTPIGFHAIAERLACLNGMVVPRSIKHLYVRHTSGVSASIVGGELNNIFPQFHKVIELWKRFVDVTPTKEQLEASMEGIFSEKHKEEFLGRYKVLKNQDRNLWGFYNILTHYTTHELKTRNKESHNLKRFELDEDISNRLASIFDTKEVAA